MMIFCHRVIDLNDSLLYRAVQIYVLFFIFSLNIPLYLAQSPEDKYKFSGNISHSMSIVLVALFCSFFVIGFFAVYVRHCMDTPAFDSSTAVLRASEGEGLDPELIEKFPIIVYSEVKDLKIGKVQLECAVCLNEFEDYESLRLLTNCDHVFHPPCIDVWLGSHVTCPVCRTILIPGGVDAEQQPVSDESISRSPLREVPNHVSINIVEYPTAENRPPGLRLDGKFPRSHSTGHSLVQIGDDLERYTLRLPEQVLKQLAVNSELNRAKSHGIAVLPRVESSRKGYRSGGEESDRMSSSLILDSGRFDGGTKSDRWLFAMPRPFFSRGGSVKSPKMDANGDVAMVGSFTRL